MFLVRERAPDDVPACVDALREVHEADGYPTWWPPDPSGWLSPRGCSAAWVAESSGVVVGHVCVVGGVVDPVVTAATGVRPDQLATVSRLFVAPAARGQGLGAALLDASLSFAVTSGLQLMLDVVEDGGAAVALYERRGWLLVDRRPADWTTPDGRRHTLRIYVAPA